MYIKHISVLALVVLISCSGLKAADTGKIQAIVAAQEKKKVEIGVEIVKAATGEKVFAHNANKPMIPASNMKLATTAAALKTLGGDFEYVTKVGLLGDKLVIIGSGDPLFGDPKMDQAAGKASGWIIDKIIVDLKNNDVNRISGIIIDRTIFDNNSIHPHWPVDQLQCWYAAQVSGLNYNDNCITVVGKAAGNRATITLNPKTNYVKIVNKAGAASGKKGAGGLWCNRQQGTNVITVQGGAAKYAVEMDITVDNPGAMFAYMVAENLPKAGINVSGVLNERLVRPEEQVRIISEFRRPIKDVIARSNKDSLQLAAECLMKTSAAYSKPWKRWGNWEDGKTVVGGYLTSIGVAGEEFRLSANALASILLDVYKSPNWGMYGETLAVGGEDGTIGRYFKEAKYRGKVIGKTGFINGVKSFSGVAKTADGDYIFSIITNRAIGSSRDAINDIVKSLF